MSLRGELGLAALLAAGVTVAIVAGRRSGAPAREFETASTFRSGPNGARGIYEVLARLGRPVARRRTPLFDLAKNVSRRPGLLVEADPPNDFESAEMAQLVAFLRRGGQVIATGEAAGVTRCAGWAPRWVGTGRRDDSLAVTTATDTPDGLSLPGVREYLQPLAGVENPREIAPKTIRSNEETRCATLVAIGADTLVRTRSGRPVVLRLRYDGGGALILVADDGWVRNRAWRTTDVPLVLLPLLSSGAGQIVFDEYHHGYGANGSLTVALWQWLADTPAIWALVQLALVALIWLIVSAFRFGPAQSVIERRRRSPLEHLDALAAGLEGAGGTDTAVALTLAGLRRRLSRTGRAPRGDARQWLATLELVLSTARGRAAARQLAALTHQPGGPERVLAAANSVEDVWEELRPRTTRDAS